MLTTGNTLLSQDHVSAQQQHGGVLRCMKDGASAGFRTSGDYQQMMTHSAASFRREEEKRSVSVKGSAAARPRSGVTCGLSFLNVFKSQQSEEITD